MKSFKTLLILASCLTMAATSALAESAVGKWTGTAAASEGPVAVSATIVAGPDGRLTGTSHSAKKKGDAALKLENVKSDGATLSFDVPEAGGSFSGTWQADKKAWVGHWVSADGPIDMVLSRAG